MAKKRIGLYTADFETTVYDDQETTEVWASAICPVKDGATEEDVIINNSFDGFLSDISLLPERKVILYFHNLKFDGMFWLSKLTYDDRFTEAFSGNEFKPTKELAVNEYKYSISDKGVFYRIIIRLENKLVEIRDSLKLLPFSVRKIGKDFRTEHRKLSIEYEGRRQAGGEITQQERSYIANDVLVMAEALYITICQQGHDKLTIGSCCLNEFKTMLGGYASKKRCESTYRSYFPDLYEIPIENCVSGHKNFDEWLRKSYRGGWCYVVEGKRGKVLHNGITLDVNSLYPYVMLSESGNQYPYGKPEYHIGKPSDFVLSHFGLPGAFYFIHLKTRFRLKPGYLPFLQIKGSIWYKGNTMLKSSDFYSEKNGVYYSAVTLPDGTIQEMIPDLYLTQTDYLLLLEHYELYDTEYIDYVKFDAIAGIFDDYIMKYRKIKETSEGAIRTLAKLFSNNLYGKMGASRDSSFKTVKANEDGTLSYDSHDESNKEAGFVAVGSAITSYARCYTIRAAQANYHGPDKPGFVYADTDSLHMDGTADADVKGVRIGAVAYGCFKIETHWKAGIFARQKGYVELVDDGDNSYYNVVCAGMPDRSKKLVKCALTGKPLLNDSGEPDKLYPDEAEFLSRPLKLEDFCVGLEVPGALKAKQLPGGVVLKRGTFKIREGIRM